MHTCILCTSARARSHAGRGSSAHREALDHPEETDVIEEVVLNQLQKALGSLQWGRSASVASLSRAGQARGRLSRALSRAGCQYAGCLVTAVFLRTTVTVSHFYGVYNIMQNVLVDATRNRSVLLLRSAHCASAARKDSVSLYMTLTCQNPTLTARRRRVVAAQESVHTHTLSPRIRRWEPRMSQHSGVTGY